MSEASSIQPEECGWVKLYHPRGPLVTFPLKGELASYKQQVQDLLDDGWLLTAPGLEEGEEKELVGYVLRGEIEHDGITTPTVLLYAHSEELKWPILKVYLNNRADVEAFQYASKMNLLELPLYAGNDKPQRGAKQLTDKFIVPAAKPFGVVFKKNPKHNPDEKDVTKKKPARLFVRWQDTKPKPAPTQEHHDEQSQPEPVEVSQEDEKQIELWKFWCYQTRPLHSFNDGFKDAAATVKKPFIKKAVWGFFTEKAAKEGWAFDKATSQFVELAKPATNPETQTAPDKKTESARLRRIFEGQMMEASTFELLNNVLAEVTKSRKQLTAADFKALVEQHAQLKDGVE